ncbi:hypothetical protein, partial [Metallibacterium sp.]
SKIRGSSAIIGNARFGMVLSNKTEYTDIHDKLLECVKSNYAIGETIKLYNNPKTFIARPFSQEDKENDED